MQTLLRGHRLHSGNTDDLLRKMPHPRLKHTAVLCELDVQQPAELTADCAYGPVRSVRAARLHYHSYEFLHSLVPQCKVELEFAIIVVPLWTVL